MHAYACKRLGVSTMKNCLQSARVMVILISYVSFILGSRANALMSLRFQGSHSFMTSKWSNRYDSVSLLKTNTTTAATTSTATTNKRSLSEMANPLSTAATTTETSDVENKKDLASLEDREKKEMEWLVQTTKELLFSEKPVTAPLSRSQCRRVHNLMKAWGTRRTEGAPHLVDKLFEHLQKNAAFSITTQTYNLRLEAWAGFKGAEAPEQCQRILASLKDHNELGPNVHSYNACIKAWIRAATPEGLERAKALVEELKVAHQATSDAMLAPNRRSFNLLLYGLTHASHTGASSREALDIFNFMFNSSEAFCQPNANTFHQVVTCLSKDGTEKMLEQTFQTCLKISFERGIDMYADTFNVYMGRWLRSDSSVALQCILTALETMERFQRDERYSLTTNPNLVTLNTVLAAHVKFSGPDAIDHITITRKRLEAAYSIKPDATTYNTIIDAYSKSHRTTAVSSALGILRVMERHLIKGRRRARPDAYTYCAVIDCLAKSSRRDAGIQSQNVLEQMVDLHRKYGGVEPQLPVYNSVLNAMSMAYPVNLTHVQHFLQKMEKNSLHDSSITPRPSTITYNSAFKAALRSHTVQGAVWADRLLEKMECQFSSGEASIKPDSFSYTTVIACFGKSSYPKKADKALELVERALHSYHKGILNGTPSVSIFNAACNACCFVQGGAKEKKHAFATMTTINALLANYTKPDQTTYGTLLRACSQLLQDCQTQQQILVRQTFEKACHDGLCGEYVMKQVQFAATPDTYKSLLGFEVMDEVSIQNIPFAWRRKVK